MFDNNSYFKQPFAAKIQKIQRMEKYCGKWFRFDTMNGLCLAKACKNKKI
jgi:hypothetical protein